MNGCGCGATNLVVDKLATYQTNLGKGEFSHECTNGCGCGATNLVVDKLAKPTLGKGNLASNARMVADAGRQTWLWIN
jgi:hypothetical protein